MSRIIGIAVFVLFGFFSVAATAVTLEIVVLDVGEGQAVLLKQGEKGVLIDTGNFATVHRTLKRIEQYGVREIEKVFLTHLHPDHATGIFAVMASHPFASIYESGHRVQQLLSERSYRWVVDALESDTWRITRVRQGDGIQWYDAKIKVLWPFIPEGSDLNTQSLVLTVSCGEKVMLLMGDATCAVEKELLREMVLPDKVELLVVGHHGADDATGIDFVNRTRPEHAVISSGMGGGQGYSNPKILSLLRQSGAVIHETAKEGDVHVQFSP